jgi:hypothetical protein
MHKADRRADEAAEMKSLWYVAGYTRKNQIHNDNIQQKLTIFNLNDKTQQNKNNWYEQILHTDPTRITQQTL